MIENGAEFVNDHYQLPCPLRNPNFIMPNNRTMIDKRANYLKNQFIKNKKFFKGYKNCMNEIMQKGCLECLQKSNHMARLVNSTPWRLLFQ